MKNLARILLLLLFCHYISSYKALIFQQPAFLFVIGLHKERFEGFFWYYSTLLIPFQVMFDDFFMSLLVDLLFFHFFHEPYHVISLRSGENLLHFYLVSDVECASFHAFCLILMLVDINNSVALKILKVSYHWFYDFSIFLQVFFVLWLCQYFSLYV